MDLMVFGKWRLRVGEGLFIGFLVYEVEEGRITIVVKMAEI